MVVTFPLWTHTTKHEHRDDRIWYKMKKIDRAQLNWKLSVINVTHTRKRSVELIPQPDASDVVQQNPHINPSEMNEEKVGGRNSWMWPILHWSFMKNCSVVFRVIFSKFSLINRILYYTLILSWWGVVLHSEHRWRRRVGAVHGPSSAGVAVLTNCMLPKGAKLSMCIL